MLMSSSLGLGTPVHKRWADVISHGNLMVYAIHFYANFMSIPYIM